jgi:hypothetical protein
MVTSHRERRRYGIASGVHVAPRVLRDAARQLELQAAEMDRYARQTREEANRLRSLAEDYEDLSRAAEWLGPHVTPNEGEHRA